MPLVPVHGGLPTPVDRILPLTEQCALVRDAERLPRIAVNDADLSTVYRIGDGTLSPITGFMDAAEYQHVLDHHCIVRDGIRWAWAIPLGLPVTAEEAAALRPGGHAVLVNTAGQPVARMTITEVYPWKKADYIRSVYLTERTDHPGAAIVVDDPRVRLAGGEIWTLPQPHNPLFSAFQLSPRQTRALIAERKWEAALAFQTRNPLHRAHEYALVHGVQELTRQGLYAGVVLMPLVGQLKGDDVDAATRMRCYRVLMEQRLLGQGDSDSDLWQGVGYDINDVFELVALDMRMFYGGPSEAIMHAIYRQNHGFSHIVIGRKHADAPYFDNTPIWGDFDAQEVFDHLPGKLAIRPVKVGFAAWYDHMGRVDLMDAHPGVKPFFISGTKVREILLSGERPDPRILRPEVADILIAAYRERTGR
ncbi:MAG: sulfate adenylyltransferase [Deltaproteobacteria bacterium]|nr:sulfate adenylyltransferase [Deltaproteobacteria bacterium]